MSMNPVPRYSLTRDKNRVSEFCSEKMGGGGPWFLFQAIGLERDGELIAGVIYDRYSGPDISLHLAAVPGRRWLNRLFLHEVLRYPFLQLEVARISGEVEASNSDALRLNAHVGFEYEATKRGAASSGDDLILMVLWKSKCRFLGEYHGFKRETADAA